MKVHRVPLCFAAVPRTFPRICPLCGKPGVSNLSSHLEIVHDLTGLRRTRLLKEAKVSWESKKKRIYFYKRRLTSLFI